MYYIESRSRLIAKLHVQTNVYNGRVKSSSDHAGATLDNSWSFLGSKGASKAGDRAESVQSLAFGHGDFWRNLGRKCGDGRVLAGRHHLTVKRIYTSIAGVGRRAGGVWRLVNVFSIDVDCIGLEGRSAITTAGISLLETEELQLGLDSVDEALTHGC